ncbi:MAG: nucleotidyl cyclase domain-containing protein [Planctomycetota bacterium]|jgi:GGDEF domain-containing protein
MPARSLTILSASDSVASACREAAAQAGAAVADVVHLADQAALDLAGTLEGLVVVDPAFMAPLSIQEWSLGFLRDHRVLLFLLTSGNSEDADGLARFVGAQGALAMPVDAGQLAEYLASPFGAPTSMRPESVEVPDAATLGASIGEILKERQPEARERFLEAVADSETGLHTPEFWEHRLEEEFKRSSRFRFPLGLAAFSWEGEINDDVLLDLAGILLLDTRDVDVATRIGPRTLVAMLPHTGPEGTRLFAERVLNGMAGRGLRDLLGENLDLSADVAVAPDSNLANSRAFLAKVLPRESEMTA